MVFLKEETEKSIPELFERQVEKFSSKGAIYSKGCQITYDDLNKKANRIAHAISATCKAENEHVALIFGHDAAALAAMIGVLKAGKGICPDHINSSS